MDRSPRGGPVRGAASGVPPGAEISSGVGPRHTAIQVKLASPLTLLRRPALAVASAGLAFGFSTLAFGRFGWTPRAWAFVPLFIALALIVVLDFRAKLIPDAITLPGLAYALVLAATLRIPTPGEAVVGALAGGGAVLLVAAISRGGMGGGDIKLMAMLGAALGWKAALAVLAVSQVVALLVILGRLVAHRESVREPLPVGALIAFLGAIMLVGRP